jgi:hypothetical protein
MQLVLLQKNNVFPFNISEDGINIDGYYYNDNEELPKYKVENKNGRLCIPKLQGYKSNEQFDLKEKIWNVVKDVD